MFPYVRTYSDDESERVLVTGSVVSSWGKKKKMSVAMLNYWCVPRAASYWCRTGEALPVCFSLLAPSNVGRQQQRA